jgi:hypothetical protein
MPIVPAQRRLKQEACEFKASLGHIARPCLKENKHKTTNDRGHQCLSGWMRIPKAFMEEQ